MDGNPALITCIKEKGPGGKEWEGRGGCILAVSEEDKFG
jgi:hypothetical protein